MRFSVRCMCSAHRENRVHQREWVVIFVYARVLKVHKDRNDASGSRDQAQTVCHLSLSPALNSKHSAFQLAVSVDPPCFRSLITQRGYRVNMLSLC